MRRRDLIRAAPALVLAPLVLPAVTMAVADPLVPMVAEWQRLHHAWEDAGAKPGAGNFDTPECEALGERKDDLAERIFEAVPVSIAGILAVLEFIWTDDGGDYASEWIGGDKQRFRNLMTGVKRLAGEAA